MKIYKKLLFAFGIALLIWGIHDFYILVTNWWQTYQNYEGTDTALSLLILGRHEFELGISKTIVALASVVLSMIHPQEKND